MKFYIGTLNHQIIRWVTFFTTRDYSRIGRIAPFLGTLAFERPEIWFQNLFYNTPI
jgi:hypothetical protein